MLDPSTLEVVLRGREVALVPLTMAHSRDLALASSESRENYRYNPVPNGELEATQYIERALRQREEGHRLPFAVTWRGRIVGATSYSDYQPWAWPAAHAELQRSDRPDAVEVGYTWLAASAQRTRCNTEAKYLLLQHAFEHWNVYRVTLRTDERNARSRQAILRLGAQFEGIRRGDSPGVDGTVRNSAFYSIVQAEWPHVRDRLLTRLGD